MCYRIVCSCGHAVFLSRRTLRRLDSLIYHGEIVGELPMNFVCTCMTAFKYDPRGHDPLEGLDESPCPAERRIAIASVRCSEVNCCTRFELIAVRGKETSNDQFCAESKGWKLEAVRHCGEDGQNPEHRDHHRAVGPVGEWRYL